MRSSLGAGTLNCSGRRMTCALSFHINPETIQRGGRARINPVLKGGDWKTFDWFNAFRAPRPTLPLNHISQICLHLGEENHLFKWFARKRNAGSYIIPVLGVHVKPGRVDRGGSWPASPSPTLPGLLSIVFGERTLEGRCSR